MEDFPVTLMHLEGTRRLQEELRDETHFSFGSFGSSVLASLLYISAPLSIMESSYTAAFSFVGGGA